MTDIPAHRTPRDVLSELLDGVGAGRWDRLHELYAEDTTTVDPNETTAVRRQRGEDIVTALNGGQRPASLEALDRDFPFLANAVNAYAVGELFARDVLDVRTRQLALVAAFATLGLGDFIKIHGSYALNQGATEDELKEIVYLTTIPGGFPRAIQASQAVAELLAQRRTR